MSRTKAIFCVPNMIIGGLETVLISTLTALKSEKDINICVITHAKIREPLYIQWFKENPDVPLYVYYPLCNWFEDIRKYCRIFPLKQLRKIVFSLYKKYRRIIMRHHHAMRDADVVIDYKNLSFFKELKNFHRRKITWCHGSFEYFKAHNLISRLGDYDLLVGLTDSFTDEFRNNYPTESNKIIRIYNPIDANDIQKRSKNAPCMPGLYFCHVSRLDQGKDIGTLLNAFDIFIKHTARQDIKLVIIGDGAMAETFQQHCATLSCANNVIFTGSLNNPYGYMKGALANILSSESEGLGMVLLESQALGVAAIAADCKNGPAEILENGNSGFLYPVGDEYALAQHLEYIIQNPERVKEKINTATFSLERFKSHNISKQILNIIRNK